MRRLLFLLIPPLSMFTKSRGNLARTSAGVLWMTLGLLFYGASSYTNYKGIMGFFVDFPIHVQMTAKFIAFSVDLLVQICFIMFLINLFKLILIHQDESIKSLFDFYPKHRNQYIFTTKMLTFAFGFFFIGLIVTTYFLSIFGGGEWANERAEQEYKPPKYTISISPLIEQEQIEKGVEIEQYKERVRQLNEQSKNHKIEKGKKDFYAKKGMWTKHSEAIKSIKWLNNYEKELKKLESQLNKRKNNISFKYKGMRETHDSEHKEQKQKFVEMKDKLEQITEWGVNVWSFASALIFIISCLLTQEDFMKEAGTEMNEYISSVRKIDKLTQKQVDENIRLSNSSPNIIDIRGSKSKAKDYGQPEPKEDDLSYGSQIEQDYMKALEEKPNMVRIVEEEYLIDNCKTSLAKMIRQYGPLGVNIFERRSKSTLHDIVDLCRSYQALLDQQSRGGDRVA